MAITIKFDSANNPLPSRLILATKAGNRIRELPISNVKFRDSFLEGSEFSFNVYKNHCLNKSGEVDESFWRRIVDFKLAYCPEFDMWYEIHLDLDESDETIKSCTAVSLAQAELSQINVYGIEVNTEADIARADYKPTVLFNPEDKECSLVDRLLYKAPHYTVKHVDYTIANIQRSFSFNDTSILDAYQEIATEYNCIFIVEARKGTDTKIERTISVYDVENYCLDCKNRGEFSGACDKCGSTNIKYGYGEDTSVFISRQNLAEEINYSTDVDSVKNCFRLEGGDDLMTATIINCNPNGSQYLWYITDEMKSDMSEALRQRLADYDELYASYQNTESYSPPANLRTQYNEIVNRYKSVKSSLEEIPENIIGFPALMTAYYNTIDLQMFLNNSMMPNVETETTDAAKEAAKLTVTNLSPVAVANLATCTENTAASAVLSVAKCFVRGSFQVKVNESSYNANTYRWTGNFTVTNYSDEEDTATSPTITVTVTAELESFVKQKIKKAMAQEQDDPTSLSALFDLELTPFKAELKKYSLQRLIAFRDACQVAMDIMIQQGIADRKSWVSAENNLYDNMYLPYYNKMAAIEDEIYTRTSELAVVVGVYDENEGILTEGMQSVILAKRNEVQGLLNFEEYLGEELWLEFASFRREDTFTNKNYISDGLSNEEIFTRAEEFLNLAQKEIYRSAVLQHSISSTLSNLLTMPEFSPIIDKFKVGNWLRIEVDGQIYRLRLVEYTIDFDSWKLSSVEFSDVKQGYNSASDIQSLLSAVRSMSSSYGSVSRQAKAGKKSQEEMENWVTDGFKLTAQKIVGGAANQEFEIGETGITGREYIPETEGYKDEQVKIISSGLYVTDDGWLTAKAGVGRFTYYNPVTKQMEEAYGVIADKLVGNLVLSQEVGIYNENNSITLDYDGFTLITEAGQNAKTFRILRREEDESLTSILSIDSNGNLVLNGYSTTDQVNSAITTSANNLTTAFNKKLESYDTSEEVATKISQSAEEIETSVERTYLKSADAQREYMAKSNAVASVATEYAVGDDDVTPPLDGWSTESPVWEEGKYIWQRTKTVNGNGTASYSEAVCIQGAAGVGIYSITEYYAINNDYDTAPADADFSTTIPQMTATEPYLWNYELTVFSDQTEKKTTKHVIGTYSITGSEIISVRQLYAASSSNEEAPADDDFVTTIPTLSNTNKYLWTTELLTYSDSSYEHTEKYVLATYSGNQITNIVNYYLASSQSTGITRSTVGWTTDMQAATPLLKYLWNYKQIVWASGNPTYTDPAIIGQYNITGEDGKSIDTITHYYLASPLQSGITWDSAGWTEAVQTVSTTNKYLWNYEIITYTEGNPTKTNPAIIGVYGDTGLTGNGISSVTEYYAKHSSNTEAPADSAFTTTIQTVDETDKYLWAYELITYTNTETSKTSKRVIGQYSKDGSNGLSSMIVHLYKRSDGIVSIDWTATLTYSFTNKSLTTVPTGWSQSVPSGDAPLYVTMATAASKTETATIRSNEWNTPMIIAESGTDGVNTATVYLYKRSAEAATIDWEDPITYTFASGSLSVVPDGWSQTIPEGADPIYITFATASSYTATDVIEVSEWRTPRVLAKNGEDGDDGISVSNVVNYYLATASSSGVTRSTAGWTTTVQSVTATKKYLWNYEEVQYSKGSPTYTDPCIVGVYGDTGSVGATGKGVSALVEEYYLSTSETTQTGGSWSENQPAWQEGHYIWTRTKITWLESDSTTSITYTTPVLAKAINGANRLASEIQDTLIENYSTTEQTDTKIQNTVKEYQKLLDTKADNLITYPYKNTGTVVQSGLTITINEDGSVVVSGTATDDVYLYLTAATDEETLPAGIYTLSMGDDQVEGASLNWLRRPVGTQGNYLVASANPQAAAVNYNYPDDYVVMYFRFQSGYTFAFTAYPQLEYGSVGHNWQPTAKSYSSQITQTSREIESRVESIEESVAALGSSNLIPCPYGYNSTTKTSMLVPGKSYSLSGISITVENDGSFTVDGTATAAITLDLIASSQKFTMPSGTYILRGNATASGINIRPYRFPNEDGNTSIYSITSAIDASLATGVSFTWNSIITNTTTGVTAEQFFVLRMTIASGATFSNVIFKPMLEIGDEPHDWVSPVYSTTSKIVASESSIRQNASSIEAKVSVGNVAAQLTIECTENGSTVNLGANKVTISSTAFKLAGNGNVTSSGQFTSTSKLTAADGSLVTDDMPIKSVLDAGGFDLYAGTAGKTKASTRLGQFGPSFLGTTSVSSPTALGFGLNADNAAGITLQARTNNGRNGSAILLQKTGNMPLKMYGDAVMYNWLYFSSSGAYIYPQTYNGVNYMLVTTNLMVNGNFSVSGSKNRIVRTDNYGSLALSAMESTYCVFSDLGSGIIDESGRCYVFVDPDFVETIDLIHDYQVFITPTSEGKIEWIEKKNDHFIVHGESGTTFDWIIYARQKGYTNDRLFNDEISLPNPQDDITNHERVDDVGDDPVYMDSARYMSQLEQDYDAMADSYMSEYESEIEDI